MPPTIPKLHSPGKSAVKVLIQRVQHASVVVNSDVGPEITGSIEQGILLFVGIEKEDTPIILAKMAKKVLSYRVFNEDEPQCEGYKWRGTGGITVHLSCGD